MRRARGRPRIEREIRVTPVRRGEIDVRRLARALLALAQADEKAHESAPEAKEQPNESA
jgi:hypothetical protein